MNQGAPASSHSGNDELLALTSLHSTEISANIGELQVTTALSLGLFTFVGVVVGAYRAITPSALLLTPAIVLVAAVYLMIRVAVVLQRAALARSYEDRIAEIAGLRQSGSYFLGSRFYGRVDDVGVIIAERSDTPGEFFSKYVRFMFAAIAAAGVYVIVVAYVVVVVLNAWMRDHPVAWGWALTATVVYAFLTLIAIFAGKALLLPPFPDPPRFVAGAASPSDQ